MMESKSHACGVDDIAVPSHPTNQHAFGVDDVRISLRSHSRSRRGSLQSSATGSPFLSAEDIATQLCPRCGAVNICTGFSTLVVWTCRVCGAAVKSRGTE